MGNFKAYCLMLKNKASYHSPELLMAAGTVSGACSLIFTALGTIKAMDTIEEHKINIEELKEAADNNEDINYGKSLARTYIHTGLKLGKNYALATGFGAISITCFFSAYGIMKKRYIALGTAYTALNASFNAYRQRVIEDKGVDQDIYYMTGVKPKTITEINPETGEKETKKVFPKAPDGSIASPYGFKFGKYKENGDLNRQWTDNINFLRNLVLGNQDYYDEQLDLRSVKNNKGEVVKRGSVFLNEIREACGEDFNTVGSVVGNRYGNGEPGCNGYIHFDLIEGIEEDPDTGKMIPYIWIEPNVDGLIYDLVDKEETHPFLPINRDNDMYY